MEIFRQLIHPAGCLWVVRQMRISEALTADRHYELVGMGFRKLF